MRNVPDGSSKKNRNARLMFNNFTPKIMRFLYNMEKYHRAEQATDNNTAMPNVCRIPKATNAYLAYLILTVFPLQQWLHESTSVLR